MKYEKNLTALNLCNSQIKYKIKKKLLSEETRERNSLYILVLTLELDSFDMLLLSNAVLLLEWCFVFGMLLGLLIFVNRLLQAVPFKKNKAYILSTSSV